MDTQPIKRQTPSRKQPEGEQRDALVLKWMRIYSEIYPMFGESMTPERGDLYCELLADLTVSELRYGLEQCAKTCSRFPTVSDIRQAIEDRPRAEKEPEPDYYCTFCGGSGWEEVRMFGLVGVKGCRCRQPGYVRPEPPPRTPLTDEERAKLADLLADKVL